MRTIGLIPVRLESTRLKDKALLDICGLPMIIHTMLRASMSSLDSVYVCTDSEKIADVVRKAGGQVLMTGPHNNGTDRIAEAADYLLSIGVIENTDFIVDIQGDEPLLHPHHIDQVLDKHRSLIDDYRHSSIVLPCAVITENIDNVNIVKMVVSSLNDRVIYLSRSIIPNCFREETTYLKQVCLVSFTYQALKTFSSTPVCIGSLEYVEGVELLRALEAGIPITTTILNEESFSVDTEDDYERVKRVMLDDELFHSYKGVLCQS